MDTVQKSVLIIEDDPNLRTVYSQKLTASGFRVMTAPDGTSGMTEAAEQKPDLILLDIMLPGGMNGFDVLRQMKLVQELKDIPVILLTNLDSEKETAKAMGAADYIVKAETSIDELVQKVKSHL